jgi:hypothetical protein
MSLLNGVIDQVILRHMILHWDVHAYFIVVVLTLRSWFYVVYFFLDHEFLLF